MHERSSQRGAKSAVYEEHAERLEHLGLELGAERGRLAMGLDLLTEALVVAGAHAVYCREEGPGGRPSADLRAIVARIEQAKELIQDVMGALKAPPRPTEAPPDGSPPSGG
jgi:hypothetical protein